MSNWALRTKEQATAVPLTKPTPAGGAAERYEVKITKIEAKAFKTGTIGFNVKYEGAGLERGVYQNFFTRLMNKETGDLTDNVKGAVFTDKFLTACGLSSDERLAFPKLKTPNDAKAIEALNGLIGSQVVILTKDREYLGRVSKEVVAVFPIDRS